LQTERQTLMFSATFPESIRAVARDFLNNYLFLSVGVVGGACTDVDQYFDEVRLF
jgi:probable ATP-dependent RNA helicase DDX4